jgi:alkylation response protein AidB-like acyl-CoA dehydrogenase
MDFTFTEEQLAVSEAAAGVFSGVATPERVATVERGESRVDDDLWKTLADAHLLGLVVPTALGGSGLGLVEACLVLEQQGRHVAPVPLWAATVLGALSLARYGTPAQQEALLPGLVEGSVRLSAALTEVSASSSRRPVATAVPDGDGFRVSGHLGAVPQAHVADRVLVPAAVGDEVVVVLVDPAGSGAELVRVLTTDRQVHPHLVLDGMVVAGTDVVAGPGAGAEMVEHMVETATVGLCALQLGVTEEAVHRAAAYCNQRHQFGRALSSFQGALLRAADAYIDTESIRVTTWQAAWRLDTGRPAAEAVAVAKWWASEAGQRVVHTTQHLHGGLGADVDYPIHRYFLWGKQIELMLGGPSAQLALLGDLVAGEFSGAVSEPGRAIGDGS